MSADAPGELLTIPTSEQIPASVQRTIFPTLDCFTRPPSNEVLVQGDRRARDGHVIVTI